MAKRAAANGSAGAHEFGEKRAVETVASSGRVNRPDLVWVNALPPGRRRDERSRLAHLHHRDARAEPEVKVGDRVGIAQRRQRLGVVKSRERNVA